MRAGWIAAAVLLAGCASDEADPKPSDELGGVIDAVADLPDCSEWVGASIDEVPDDVFTEGCVDGDTIYAGKFTFGCVTFNGYVARVEDGDLFLATSDEANDLTKDC